MAAGKNWFGKWVNHSQDKVEQASAPTSNLKFDQQMLLSPSLHLVTWTSSASFHPTHSRFPWSKLICSESTNLTQRKPAQDWIINYIRGLMTTDWEGDLIWGHRCCQGSLPPLAWTDGRKEWCSEAWAADGTNNCMDLLELMHIPKYIYISCFHKYGIWIVPVGWELVFWGFHAKVIVVPIYFSRWCH